MKRLCVLTMVMFLLLGTTSAIAADPLGTMHSKLKQSTTHVEINYNFFGIATYSKSTTTEVREDTDFQNKVTTETTVTVVESFYRNGGLKAETSHTNSKTRDGSGTTGNLLSESDSTDTFTYNADGRLLSVSGTGTFKGYTYDKDNKFTGTRSGTITRTFTVKDGQPLLLESKTTGDVFDKDNKKTGTFTNTATTALGDYSYLGGQWVPMKRVSISTENGLDGSSETTTRTTSYTRDANGVINGISQTLTGSRTVVTGNTAAGAVASQTSEIRNYTATAGFHPQLGWQIIKEEYDWELTSVITNPAADNPGGHSDPVLYGIVTSVVKGGVTYVGLKAELVDILDGQGLQKADGKIWIILGEEASKLKGSEGKKVMVMGDIGYHVGGATDGDYVLQINKNYGGGTVTENAEQRLGTYQQEGWYQENKSIMQNIWNGAKYYWEAGVKFLQNLFGPKPK